MCKADEVVEVRVVIVDPVHGALVKEVEVLVEEVVDIGDRVLNAVAHHIFVNIFIGQFV